MHIRRGDLSSRFRRRVLGVRISDRRIAETLAELSGILVEVRDTDRVAQRVVDQVRKAFDAQGALVSALDPESASLRGIAVAGNIGSEYGAHWVYPPGTGAAGLAATKRKAVATSNILTDPRIVLTAEARGVIERAPFRAVLAAPMLLDDRLIGTVCVLDHGGRVFTDDEAHFAQAFAHQAALALDNARLYEIAEAQRREANAARAEAVAASRAKDIFLATLSHELRTPLNAIFGWARLLRTAQMDKQKAQRALEIIERNALVQTQLVSDLLDVAGIVTGKLRVDIGVVDLSSLIADSVASLRQEAGSKGVALELRGATEEASVLGDALRLHQVIVNLVNNAVRFTPRGGRVTVALSRREDYVRVTVTDTGRGIPAALLPHIFDPFSQGDPAPGNHYRGLGLGLALVRDLVALHGGTVAVESAGEGQGATFTVELPMLSESVRAQAPTANTGGGMPRQPRDEPSVGLDGVRVLVVEDHPDTRELVAVVLRQSEAEVRTAGSIAEAVDVREHEDIDIVVSDVGLPDGDGYELLRRLREVERARLAKPTPAIALTGFASSDDEERARAAGYTYYVVKPIDPFALVGVIGKAAGRIAV